MLTTMPSSGVIRNLALALKALLPMPINLDPRKDTAEVREWVLAHFESLKWNEVFGAYRLIDHE